MEYLQDKYYNINSLEKYLVQSRSQAKSSGMILPGIHGVGKGLNPSVQPGKQVIRHIISKVGEVSQIKPRLGQGRAELRCKTKTPTVSLFCKSCRKNH